MSSPIHSARCLARRDATVEIDLEPTTASDPHFPFSRFFALALLHECATTIVYRAPGDVWRWSGAVTPLGAAVGEAEILDLSGETDDDDGKRALASTFIRNVEYVSARNWVPGRDDLDEVFERAVRERRPRPGAVLRIDAVDAQWVEHVERGMLWDVYAFDDAAPHWPLLS